MSLKHTALTALASLSLACGGTSKTPHQTKPNKPTPADITIAATHQLTKAATQIELACLMMQDTGTAGETIEDHQITPETDCDQLRQQIINELIEQYQKDPEIPPFNYDAARQGALDTSAGKEPNKAERAALIQQMIAGEVKRLTNTAIHFTIHCYPEAMGQKLANIHAENPKPPIDCNAKALEHAAKDINTLHPQWLYGPHKQEIIKAVEKELTQTP